MAWKTREIPIDVPFYLYFSSFFPFLISFPPKEGRLNFLFLSSFQAYAIAGC